MPADSQQMQVERPMERSADGQFGKGRSGGRERAMAANPLQKQPNGAGRLQARPASVDSIDRSTPSLARARCHLAPKS